MTLRPSAFSDRAHLRRLGHQSPVYLGISILASLALLVLTGLSYPSMALSRQSPRPLQTTLTGQDQHLVPPLPIAGLESGPAAPLEFSRAWLARAEEVRQRRSELRASGELDGVSPDSLAALGAALTGQFRIPVIPVHYSNAPAPFHQSVIHDRIFGPAQGDSVTLASYWHEVSGGLLTIEGGVTPWVRLKRPGSYYLRKDEYGWANFGRAHDLVRDALRGARDLIDFNGFDNDGPDGIPNSGDDDGFVDLVVILYAVPCNGEWREGAIWPHRGAIPPYETNARTASGEPLRVSDYLILPVQEPGSCEPFRVGTLAHETGHALGLPDLYDYENAAAGAGAWDLMATGSHNAPHSPAHLSAWSKEQLGWVRVNWLEADRQTLTIPPVTEEHTIFRYDLPGESGEYILLENRQRIGSDSHLPGTGLLVWKTEPDHNRLGSWNGVGRYRGVELIRAGKSGPSSAPFPGSTHRDRLELGEPSTIRISEIGETDDGSISLEFHAGYSEPTLLAPPLQITLTPDDSALTRNIRIKREGGAEAEWSAQHTAGWADVRRLGNLLQVTVDPAGLDTGLYTDTIQLLLPEATGKAAPALKASVDDELVPMTSGAEQPAELTNDPDTSPGLQPAGTLIVQLEVMDPAATDPSIVGTDLPWGWGLAVDRRGRILQASFGRDALSLRPRPRLLRSSGPDTDPETIARPRTDAIYAPVAGPNGKTFVIGRDGETNQIITIQRNGKISTLATLPGSDPAYGMASFPDGRLLIADWTGKIRQVARSGESSLWTDLRTRIYQIALDNNGILYAAAHNGNILRFEPSGRLTTIPTGLGAGRLLAITSAPDGSVFAAERGGAGRILRLSPDGGLTEVARTPNAEFYGLTVDDRFLYTLDLYHRQVTRIPLAGLTAIQKKIERR